MNSARAGMLVLLLGCSIGCGATASTRNADSPEARRLDGTWLVRMRIERARFAPLSPGESAQLEVRGEVALLPNHWLKGTDVLENPTHYGAYDMDFARFGFDPRQPGDAPHAVAAVHDGGEVEILLEPENTNERVRLRGLWTGDSIVGVWSLEADRIGGDAAGSFALTRSRAY